MTTLNKFLIDLLIAQRQKPTGKCDKYNAGYILGLAMAQGAIASHCKDCWNEKKTPAT
jgi:hypothetical protein